MKRMRIAVLLLLTVSAVAQEQKPPAEEMMALYVEAAKPAAEHQRLTELSGPWKVSTKLWLDPAADAQSAAGSGNGKMILGGRFLQLEMDVKGAMGSEAMTLLGFDRRTNEYTMVGLDTHGTYYITAAGKYDEAHKGVVFRGSYAQPPSGEEQEYFFVWTKPSEREQLLTLFFTMNGKDVRVAETLLVR